MGIISRLPFGGSSSKELHGASILVATEETDLIGETVDLYFGDVIVKSGVFNAEGTCLFTDILEIGEYTAKVDDITNKTVVTVDDIFNKNVLEIDIYRTIDLVVGNTYTFGGYDWTCAEDFGDYYCLQSQGVTGGAWPGYTMSKFGSANNYYSSNIDGQDISDYNQTTKNLYNSIKAAEKLDTGYGSGLFLVSNVKAGQTTAGNQGSGNYWSALKTAATNHSSFGAGDYGGWLGTVGDSKYAWFVNHGGYVFNYYQYGSLVVAPAYNIDKSKVILNGTTILVR